MGEIRDHDDDPDEVIEALFGPERRFRSATWRLGAPFPSSVLGMPLVVDTDIGGDPDDTLALAITALHDPGLALVQTTDEQGGERARFARLLLDLCGRPDVPVLAGPELAAPGPFVARPLILDEIPAQLTDLTLAAQLCDSVSGPVRWLGIGPMTNLARLLSERPDLAQRLTITQMGGALNYRHPDRAEHNIRLDVPAARVVLSTARRPLLVTSDVTFCPEMQVTAASPVFRTLASSPHGWAQLVVAHLNTWFANCYSSSMQHDGLALAGALQQPFLSFGLERVALDEIGRMSLSPDGHEVFLSYGANYPIFMAWLERQLSASPAPASRSW